MSLTVTSAIPRGARSPSRIQSTHLLRSFKIGGEYPAFAEPLAVDLENTSKVINAIHQALQKPQTAGPDSATDSGGQVATTAATNVAPYGYTTQAQADAIITLLNKIQTALVAAGIMT
jgi:hypothetical protein